MSFSRFSLAFLAGLAAAAAGVANEFSPAIVYDFGGKFDRSFNQSASEGAQKFKADTGIAYREFEITNAAQREQIMAQLARRGATIIDAVVDLPNVQSINFREQESSFLCGMAAALASKTGKIGFVGGMDIPLIRKFALGYVEGARHVNPTVEVFQNMTGTTPTAWGDPTKGGELARSQFGRGADVVFHAAGATGIGVMQAAQDAGMLSIGCDSNQDYLHPGSVLTSAVKRVDVAVYKAFSDARSGTWRAGQVALGLAENGVDYSYDEYNRGILTPTMKQRLDQARADIVAGRIKVSEYKP